MKRRMSKLFGIAAVSLALMGAPDAKAVQFKTGNDLAKECNSDNANISWLCIGYLEGVSDMAETASDLVCMQKGTTVVQLWLVIWNFMKAHPQDMNRSAGLLSFAAFAQAFPCPKATSSRRQDPTS